MVRRTKRKLKGGSKSHSSKSSSKAKSQKPIQQLVERVKQLEEDNNFMKKNIEKLNKDLEASKLKSFRDIDQLNENISRNKNSQLEKLMLIVDHIKLLGAKAGINIDRRLRFIY